MELTTVEFHAMTYFNKAIPMELDAVEMSALLSPAHVESSGDSFLENMMESWTDAPKGAIVDWLVLPENNHSDQDSKVIETELCLTYPLAGAPSDPDMYKRENSEAMRMCIRMHNVKHPRQLPGIGFNTRSEIVDNHAVVTRTFVRLDYQWTTLQFTTNSKGTEVGPITLFPGAPYPWCAHFFAPQMFEPLHKVLGLNQHLELEDTERL